MRREALFCLGGCHLGDGPLPQPLPSRGRGARVLKRQQPQWGWFEARSVRSVYGGCIRVGWLAVRCVFCCMIIGGFGAQLALDLGPLSLPLSLFDPVDPDEEDDAHKEDVEQIAR